MRFHLRGGLSEADRIDISNALIFGLSLVIVAVVRMLVRKKNSTLKEKRELGKVCCTRRDIVMSDLVIGIVSGIIASIIVLVATFISEYSFRKKIEKCRNYELEYVGERDICAPPEYPRETIYVEPMHEKGVSQRFYETLDIVKLQLPFDIREIQIYEHGMLVYPTDDIKYLPAGDAIFINCKLSIEDEEPAFVVKCKTFRHEYREYEYSTSYKYSGVFSRFGLRMVIQKFIL